MCKRRRPGKIGLCKGKAFEYLGKCNHILRLFVVTDKPVTDFTTGLYDQAGNVDKGIHNPFEFYSHNDLAQQPKRYQQSISGFQVPGQGSDDHICPVGSQMVRRCVKYICPILQLFNIVFVVSPISVISLAALI